ncbi:MAG: DUF2339 domain-containing protein [Deltaproteobacteria bacterium]|nr:MAG: DUF2339 domain-containing protein [Deltaproteobacteria bacterium]
MADERGLRQRIEGLEKEVGGLRQRLERLEAALAEGVVPKAPEVEKASTGLRTTPDNLLSWAGKASLLPRVATLCFIMVVALALRTATDNELINQQLGTILGISYAAILMIAGWLLYGRRNAQAPVFTVAGAILLFSVVVETQAHFKSLSPQPAYFALMVGGGVLAAIGFRYKVSLPVIVGTIGMCLSGMAIDYPTPLFSYLTPLMLMANGLALLATRLKRCSWLRWFVLAMTMLVMQVWSFKLGLFLVSGHDMSGPLAMSWFFPVLIVYALAFGLSSILGIVRTPRGEPISKFDFAVPTITAFWVFGAAYYIVHRGSFSPLPLGAVGIVGALGLYGVAVFLARRRDQGAPGVNTFALAGTVLLSLSLPVAFENRVLAVGILAPTGLLLAHYAREWGSGGARLTSYLAQLVAAVCLGVWLYREPAGTGPAATMVVALVALVAGVAHYRFARRNPPPEASLFFNRFDRGDRLANLVLLAGLLGGFFFGRAALYIVLHRFPGNLENAFICGQSVIINLAAMALLLLGWVKENRELRNLAILVTLVGAAKVFMVDMLSTKGVPLVLSVLSFGVVAAVESVVLARWSTGTAEGESAAGTTARDEGPGARSD